MNLIDIVLKRLNWLPPRLARFLERQLKRIPAARRLIERQYEAMLAEMKDDLKPYHGAFERHTRLPENGRSPQSILNEISALKGEEEAAWRQGYVSGAIYHGDPDHIEFLNQVYALHSQSNPLHADVWPSATKFEAEIVSMTADMLGSRFTADEIVGAVSSGGTESILLAMKTYRDWARRTKGITRPEIVAPVTAHAAFDKAAHYFGLKLVSVPVDDDCRADLAAVEAAINKNTIALVGSAPAYPHGVIDPIADLAGLALRHGLGCHVDACLGGFVLPWADKLGYETPPFDFRLPGVTSMSADTHKYGYAAKGTSVVLYRGRELRRFQYYTITEWPGGLYFSPTIAGSRPGGLSAACWAAMVTLGEEGYMEATRRILETAVLIKKAIRRIPDLRILGDPLWVIAFTSDDLNIYQVMEQLGHRGWSLNGLHKPPAVHLAITLRHTQPGVAERFVSDLEEAAAYVKAHPDEVGATAPVYGMAATIPMRGMVSDLLERYIDTLYEA